MKILSGLGPQGGLVGLLILGDGLQGHLQTVERNHIPRLQGAQGRILAVDLDAALGADVADGPAAVIVSGEDRVAPGNGGQVNDNVAALVPANDILPVGNGQLIAIGQTQPGPDLRLLPEGKQALGAAQKQEGCQYRQKNPHGSAVQVRKLGATHGKATQAFYGFKKALHEKSLPFP